MVGGIASKSDGEHPGNRDSAGLLTRPRAGGIIVAFLRTGRAAGPAGSFVGSREVLPEVLVAPEERAEAIGSESAEEEGHDGDHGHFAEPRAEAWVWAAALVIEEDRRDGEAEDAEEDEVRQVVLDHGGGAALWRDRPTG